MAASFPYPPNVEAIVETFANPIFFDPNNPYPIQLDCTINGQSSFWYATPNDVTDYGRDIYDRAMKQEWGTVAPYVEPVIPPPTQDQLLNHANYTANTYRSNSYLYDVYGNGTNQIYSDITDGTTAEINALIFDASGTTLVATAEPAPRASTFSCQWTDNFGTVSTLNAAQVITLGTLTSTYRNSLYNVLAQAATGITNGTITTTDEIDALPWPVGASMRARTKVSLPQLPKNLVFGMKGIPVIGN